MCCQPLWVYRTISNGKDESESSRIISLHINFQRHPPLNQSADWGRAFDCFPVYITFWVIPEVWEQRFSYINTYKVFPYIPNQHPSVKISMKKHCNLSLGMHLWFVYWICVWESIFIWELKGLWFIWDVGKVLAIGFVRNVAQFCSSLCYIYG